MIIPTVGRQVWVRRSHDNFDKGTPEAATVVYVWNATLINVAGYDHNGNPFVLTSLQLLQDNDVPFSTQYAEWMPFQKGQAK